MSVATEAMESLVACSTDESQVLTSLRCLTRMKVTSIVSPSSTSSASALEAEHLEKERNLEGKDMKSVISYISTAYEKLVVLFQSQGQRKPAIDLDSEASWFMKIAWNMALMCQAAANEMLELFLLCNKLAALCPRDISNVIRQKRCMLMSACLCLQLAKSTKEERAKKKYLEDALLYVGESRLFCARAEDFAHSTSDNAAKETTSLVLLLLYEFEARVRLNDGEAEKLFEHAISLPYADAKTFETMAALARQSGHYVNLSMKALKVAVKKYRTAEKIDYVKCSGAMRSLIELALQVGLPTDAASKKEAWNYYLDAGEFIENTAKEDYPEMEIVWLMTKAWNCGIHLYSAGHYQDAMRWCELGVSFLKHLRSFRSSYENQMMTAYGEILAKVDSQKTLSGF